VLPPAEGLLTPQAVLVLPVTAVMVVLVVLGLALPVVLVEPVQGLRVPFMAAAEPVVATLPVVPVQRALFLFIILVPSQMLPYL